MNHEKIEIDCALIGGGIIGLLSGIAYLKRFPGKTAIVFEKESYLGDHTTGRNSGVLHSGIYYPTNSLKHTLCLKGLESWKTLIEKLQLPHHFCGKYIFAKNSSEADVLGKLELQAQKNDVLYSKLTKEKLKTIQAYVNVADALFIPSTGMLDVSRTLYQLESYFIDLGGHVLKNHLVQEIKQETSGYGFKIPDGSLVACTHLLNCAGLDAVSLGQSLWHNQLKNYFVKGNYLKYSGNFFNESFLYPCPEPKLKGLGIHSTFDFEKQIRFGPNTEEVQKIDYAINQEQVEVMRDSVEQLYKNIAREKLSPDYSGIRPKILLNGELYPDFWIKGPLDHGLNGYIELCGIESPGLTAAPAIAEYVVKLFT